MSTARALLFLCSSLVVAYDLKDPTADHTAYALELHEQGRDELALASLAAAVRFRGSVEDFINWAHGFLKVGDRENAAIQFKKVLELEPHHAEATAWVRKHAKDMPPGKASKEAGEDETRQPSAQGTAAALHAWRAKCGNPLLWVSPVHRSPGYHALCLHRDDGASGSESTKVLAFQNGHRDSPVTATIALGATMSALRVRLERLLHIKAQRTDGGRAAAVAEGKRWIPQKWRLFNSANGTRVRRTAQLEALCDTGTPVLLFEGGQWIWPGIEIGFERRVHIERGSSVITLKTMALQPLLFAVQNFLTEKECDHLIEQAAPHMAKSAVSLMDRDVGKDAVEFRTSETTFVGSHGDPLMQDIDRRVAALTRIDASHQESVQVLKYGKGARYDPHLDYWDPKYYTDESVAAMTHGGLKNRLATVFWYITNVESGGHTSFPLARGKFISELSPTPTCPYKLGVKPEAGKVIVFYSLKPDGSGDDLSQHSACPVTSGTKWAANKWVWNQPQGFMESEKDDD